MELDITPEDIAGQEPIVFEPKTVVEMVCLECEENVQYSTIMMRCKILNTSYAGRRYQVRVQKKYEPPMVKERLVRWATAFFTKEEIINSKNVPLPLARLVGRKFSVSAQKPREYNGKTYQDMDYFRDLGPMPEGDSVPASASEAGGVASDNLNDIPF